MPTAAGNKHRVIIDTDANNELDDQHALAYLLLNQQVFDVAGITVNRTEHGGPLEAHVAEADRVLSLCGLEGEIPILAGADGDFESIRPHLAETGFDGQEAVDFIIHQARSSLGGPLVLLPIGKLTNIALALARAPDIAERVKIVWLGSNYPEPGEYNLENDIPAMNWLLQQDVHFEMVTVRYGKPDGTDAVRVTPEWVRANLAGKGPVVTPAVVGRTGHSYQTFGDYSVDLFKNIDLYGDPPARALFDLAAVAIVKDPTWADSRVIPAPKMETSQWIDQPQNTRTIVLWENFQRDLIIEDFVRSIQGADSAH